MAEHEIMWIGRRPGATPAVESPAGTADYAEAITGACAACGAEVGEYVAAAGAFGSWLVHLSRGGRRQRLVWNGREGTLVLEQAEGPARWQELARATPASRDLPGLVAASTGLLGREPA